MMAILFLIGQGMEKPEVDDELLNTEKIPRSLNIGKLKTQNPRLPPPQKKQLLPVDILGYILNILPLPHHCLKLNF